MAAYFLFNDQLERCTYTAGSAPATPIPGQFYVETTGSMSVANPKRLQTPRLAEACKITGSSGTVKFIIDWPTVYPGSSQPVEAVFLSGVKSNSGSVVDFSIQVTVTYVTSASHTSSSYNIDGVNDIYALIDDDEFSWYGTSRIEVLLTFGSSTWDIDIGRLYCGIKYKPPEGFDAGWEIKYTDSGSVKYSESGLAYPKKGVVSRSLKLSFKTGQGDVSNFGGAATWARVVNEAATTRDIVAALRTDPPSSSPFSYLIFHGIFDRFDPIKHVSADTVRVSVSVDGLL